MRGFPEQFGDISDPRVERTKKYKLIDILFITMAAVICGCDEWEEIEEYAQNKESWLRGYIELPNGIPSHDTINRVISAIDPKAVQACFVQWVQGIATLSEGEVISIDGGDEITPMATISSLRTGSAGSERGTARPELVSGCGSLCALAGG